MKYILRFLAPIACLFLFASCSDNPASPTNSAHFTPEYHATLQSMDGDILSVCGAGNGELYALGPAILHYDGTRWDAIEAVPTIDRFSRLQFLQGFSDGSIIVSDGRKTFLRKDRAWNDISDGDRFVDRLWGSAPDNLYSVGFGSARH